MSVVYFLLLVGVLVTVHELGHFAMARALGIHVLRLSLGFGPALVTFRRASTEYRVGMVPLGGYVRLLGEDPHDLVPTALGAGAFSARPLWQRLAVVFAGPAANLLAPLLIYFFFYLGHTEVPAAVIGDVLPQSPAYAAGLAPGDEVVSIDGHAVATWEALETVVARNPDRSIRISVRRSGEVRSLYVTPRRRILRKRDGSAREEVLIGITQAPIAPRVGVLDDAGPAASAGLRTGDLVISVEGEAVDSWTVLARELGRHSRHARLAYLRPVPAPGLGVADVAILRAGLADVVPRHQQDASGVTRVDNGITSAELFVGTVAPDSPAARAGLRPGDAIAALDDAEVHSWLAFEQALLAEPERTHRVSWQRARAGGGTETLAADIVQERRSVRDEVGHIETHVIFGATRIQPRGQGRMVPIDGRFGYAAAHAVSRTGQSIAEVAGSFGSLVSGRAPSDAIGGPIMMYRIAAVSGEKGWDYFLLMIALVSINLGLLNLLPIPVLDGGYVVIFAVEAVLGRRLSPRARDGFLTAGLFCIVAITVIALRNDLYRTFS